MAAMKIKVEQGIEPPRVKWLEVQRQFEGLAVGQSMHIEPDPDYPRSLKQFRQALIANGLKRYSGAYMTSLTESGVRVWKLGQ